MSLVIFVMPIDSLCMIAGMYAVCLSKCVPMYVDFSVVFLGLSVKDTLFLFVTEQTLNLFDR